MGTLDKTYDLLLGRKTYDIFAGHWPKDPADDPIGPVFTKAKKYVLTRGSTTLQVVKVGSRRVPLPGEPSVDSAKE